MSNIISIKTLAGEFSNSLELKDYCDKQFETIKILAEDNKNLKEEIEHLKFIIASNTQILNPDNKIVKIIVPVEQALIEEQIKLLHDRALGKELDLEDTKKLDLLIKNLKILKEQVPIFDGKPKKKSKISNVNKLLEVASTTIAEPETTQDEL